jgi:hypothetical protein
VKNDLRWSPNPSPPFLIPFEPSTESTKGSVSAIGLRPEKEKRVLCGAGRRVSRYA